MKEFAVRGTFFSAGWFAGAWAALFFLSRTGMA